MATLSIWLEILLFKIKWFCDVAKRREILSSFLVIFRLRLWMRMRFIAVSMVSWSGLLVKRLVISKEPKQFWEIFGILTWENLRSLQG